jgi:imidazolonepropionase-like amidohydrolase
MTNFNIGVFVLSVLLSFGAVAQQDSQASQILFKNVKIFDGVNDKLISGQDVLVEGNLIKEIGAKLSAPNATVIDGGGRTLMPGLIESHVHLNLQHMVGGYDTIEHRDWQEIGAMAATVARSLLMDGWTTARDPGASLTGIRTAIERGDALGPRLYMANAVISQTAGHGDFRLKGQRTLDTRSSFKAAELGMTYIVDGYDATLSAARQNLANGAVFNKMMLSGGVFSSKDPLHTVQGTDAEVTAVVEASKAWGTYATAHVNNASDVQRGIRLGLGEIMHGQFLDDETAKMMSDSGVFYNAQLSVSSEEAIERTFGPGPSVNKTKSMAVAIGMANIPGIIKKYPKLMARTAFGVDTVTNTPANAIRNRDHEVWFWANEFGNLQALKSMTSIGGDLAALTGLLNPYPLGKLGVIEEGAYADILLIDGNPLEDITLIGGSQELFDAPDRKAGEIPAMQLIMKDGVIYKNTLD